MRRAFYTLLLLLLLHTTTTCQIFDATSLYQNNPYFFPKFELMDEEMGFGKKRISSLLEDHKGNLWIGTVKNGLWKYDGYEFIAYTQSRNDKQLLKGNDVMALLEDKQQRIWLGTSSGLCYIDSLGNLFKLQTPNTWHNENINPAITCLMEDPNGNIIAGSNGQIFITSGPQASDSLENSVVAVILNFHDDEVVDRSIFDMQLDSRGYLWLVLNRKVACINYSALLTQIPFEKQSFEVNADIRLHINSRYVRTLYVDEHDVVWIPSENSLYKIYRQNEEFVSETFIAEASVDVRSYLNQPKHHQGTKLWMAEIATRLTLFDVESESFYPLTFESNPVYRNLHNFGISCMIKTRSNAIFVGTAWGGLYKFNAASMLSNFHPDIHRLHVDVVHNLRYVYVDSKDFLWLIVDKLYCVNRYTGEVLAQFDDDFFDQAWSYKNKMIEDDQGNYWITMEGVGLIKLDVAWKSNQTAIDQEKCRYYKLIDPGLTTDIFKDPNGNILAGYYANGENNSTLTILLQFDASGKLIEQHTIKEWTTQYKTREDIFIYHVSMDPSGDIWLATGFGLVYYQPATHKSQIYTYTLMGTEESNECHMSSVCHDHYLPDEYLWAGSFEGGLMRFHKSSESFVPYDWICNYSGSAVGSIIYDDDANLWITCEQGIVKLKQEEGSGNLDIVKHYTVSDGLITNDFTYYYGHNALQTSKGELVFTGAGGFQIIDPTAKMESTLIPNLSISELYLNQEVVNAESDNSLLQLPIQHTGKLILSYDQNNLGFQLTVPELSNAGNIQYAIRLENYHNDWIEMGSDRSIQFTKLPPGKYKVLAKAAYRNNEWGQVLNGPLIIIRPPWWRSIYAYIAYSLLFLILAWLIYRSFRNRQRLKLDMEINRMEAQKLKELDEMKSKFFTNISHEFRTPLTLIMNPVDRLAMNPKYLEEKASLDIVKRNANRLLQHISEILELSKLDASKIRINQRMLNLVHYCNYIVSSYTSLADYKNIQLTVECSQDSLLFPLDPEKFQTILSNLIINAIKYTPENGTVKVSLHQCKRDLHEKCDKKESCFILTVKDTGLGIPSDHLPYIFNRYYRLKRNEEESVLGSGIGLSLVKELVNIHKGSIEVKSKEGEFTHFTMQFPYFLQDGTSEEIYTNYAQLTSENDQNISDQVNVKENNQGKEKKIILLIEDNKDMQSVLHMNLQDEYNILQAFDGNEGEKMALKHIPDLIISDVMMPEKDGFEVCRALKLNEISSHIPVILLTAKADINDKLLGLQTGADDYLIKPFNGKELLTRVHNLLQQREKLKVKYSQGASLASKNASIRSIDEVFLEKVEQYIIENIADEELSVQRLYEHLGMSRTQLHRKLTALTNNSANDLIRNIRLEKAAEMIRNNTGSISEIAFKVGFSNPPYFSKIFKEQFNCTPSEYKEM